MMSITVEVDSTPYTYNIGFTTYDSTLGIDDYSRKERDAFGELTIIQRGYSRTVKYKVEVEPAMVERVLNVLAFCRARKATFTGHADRPELNVYGVMSSFEIDLKDWGNVELSLEVESEVIDAGASEPPPVPW